MEFVCWEDNFQWCKVEFGGGISYQMVVVVTC
jgi:hypothetical protein